MTPTALLALALAYVTGLLAVAGYFERRDQSRQPLSATTYALALAVYCSSWTFYGAVGSMAAEPWSHAPIYLGPVLLVLLGGSVLSRLIEVGHRQRVTSIADFLGARYGKQQMVAATVALICLIAVLPYLALQFRALQQVWTVVNTGTPVAPTTSADNVTLLVALGLALFAILFGVRRVDGSERQRGLMHAMAVESVVKLVAFVVVALLSVRWLRTGTAVEIALPTVSLEVIDADFIAQVLISGLAILTLPRQFHVAVVEVDSLAQTRRARWLFPLYLLLFMLLAVPIATAGQALFAATGSISADTFVQRIPMALGSGWGTAAAFLGGISAATGMVLVATVSVAIMVTNEIVTPLLFRISLGRNQALLNLGTVLRRTRQITIFAIALAAWLVAAGLSGIPGLTQIGFLSFLGSAQLAPALLLGLYWPRASGRAALAGMVGGALTWLYLGVLPALFGEALLGTPALSYGQLAVLSLGFNLALCVGLTRLLPASAADLRQAEVFLGAAPDNEPLDLSTTGIPVLQLRNLVAALLSELGAQRFWRELELGYQQRLLAADRAPRFVVDAVESVLANAVGATSARQILLRLERDRQLQLADLTGLLGDARRVGAFNRESLEAALENLTHGVVVVDGELRLLAWNSRYEDMFAYPARFLFIGCPVERVYQFNAERGILTGSGRPIRDEIDRRLTFMRSGSEHSFERIMPDGRVLEIHGKPIPGGGFVTTYIDITDFREIVTELEEARQELENRVVSGEEALSQRNAQLRQEVRLRTEAENELRSAFSSKAHVMSATSHDLLQPINAASLLAGAIRPALPADDPITQQNFAQLSASLDRAQTMIGELREMARLDAGGLRVDVHPFPLHRLFDNVAAGFTEQAAERGLALRVRRTRLWVSSDERTLTRILENLLANAIKYTSSGRVLLGVRRRGDTVRVLVADTGPGIPETDQARIFAAFERLERAQGYGAEGLGLGLSLVARYAEALGTSIELHSVPGAGSQFYLDLPRAAPGQTRATTAVEPGSPQVLLSGRVLCLDNDHSLLQGLASLLEGFGLGVSTARSGGEAAAWIDQPGAEPLLLIADYHLDAGETGVSVALDLRARGFDAPVLIVSADDTSAVREAVRAAGFRFLPKPLEPARLRALLEALARQAFSRAGG